MTAKILLLLLALVCFLCVLCALVLVWLYYDRPSNAGLPQRSWWRIAMVDVNNGIRMEKIFHAKLILGRTVSAAEPAGVLFIGTDQTISRIQCEIFDFQNSLVVRNLSGVNATWHNGLPLREVHALRQGDFLDMGGSRYVLEQLDRVA